MSGTKFTKGPLYIGHGFDTGGETGEFHYVAPENGGSRVRFYFDGTSEAEANEALADAQLYAAAPDLYAMLNWINEELHIGLLNHTKVTELLARARGESQ